MRKKEEAMRRLLIREDVGPEVFNHTAQLIRTFVEQYHEQNEEKYIFPEFERAKKLVDLVERSVDKVATIEKELGIYNLAQFTPKV